MEKLYLNKTAYMLFSLTDQRGVAHDGHRLLQVLDSAHLGDLAGAYSRRINIQHRVVYEVFPKERAVRVLRLWSRYEAI